MSKRLPLISGPSLTWAVFSQNDATDVLSRMDDPTQDRDTVDELGFGTIRDFYSDLFFPGVTTLSSRARYFFIVPALLGQIERLAHSAHSQKLDPYKDLLRVWEHKVNLHFLQLEREGKLFDNEFVGQRTHDRSFSEIYWRALASGNGEGGFGIVDKEYETLALRQSLHEFWKMAKTEVYDDNIPVESRQLFRVADILAHTRVTDAITFKRYALDIGSLRQLGLRLTPKEASYLKGRLCGLYKSESGKPLSNLWNPLISSVSSCKSWEQMKQYRANWGNLVDLGTLHLKVEVEDAVLFNRLARTMYIAYWYHVAERTTDKNIRTQRKELRQRGIRMMRRLAKRKSHFERYISSTLPTLGKYHFGDPIVLRRGTPGFLKQWVSILGTPDLAFQTLGKSMLARQESRAKTESRARLRRKHVSTDELRRAVENHSSDREFSYSFRFHRAVTVAFDIASALIGREKKT